MKKTILMGLAMSLLAITCKKNEGAPPLNADSMTTIKDSVAHSVEKPVENLPIQDIVDKAKQHFEEYQKQLVKNKALTIGIIEPYTGDFTGDGKEDVVIQYSLEPTDGGNYLAGQGLVLYRNIGNDVEFIKDYEHPNLFTFSRISIGNIYITELEYAEEDPRCCPSIETTIQLSVNGNKITSKKVN